LLSCAPLRNGDDPALAIALQRREHQDHVEDRAPDNAIVCAGASEDQA
jgi:hypothetical protein